MLSKRLLFVPALLVMAILAAACGGDDPTPTPTATARPSTSAPTPTPIQKAAWEVEWDETVAAANAEGKVIVTVFRQPDGAAAKAFQSFFPEIEVEVQIIQGRAFSARVPAEHAAGVFTFDVFLSGSTTGSTNLCPNGILGDTRSQLIRPDVIDDSNWLGGDFDDWWGDDTVRTCMSAPVANFGGSSFRVNRNVAPDVTGIRDWIDPQWKGKICWEDPRSFGGGDIFGTNMMVFQGTDFLRQVLTEQDVIISRNLAQLAADTVRGDCALSVGGTYTEFENEGLMGHVDRINLALGDIPPEFASQTKIICCGAGKNGTTIDGQLSSAVGGPALIVGAPHPNATKVFLNWWMTPEGQIAWGEANNWSACSARADLHFAAPCRDADKSPEVEGSYISYNYASNAALRRATNILTAEILGG
ncbi:MAG: hypothetical protein V3S25_07585 [Nitrospirales bacterium]